MIAVVGVILNMGRKVQIALVKSKLKHCIGLEQNTDNDVVSGVTVKLFQLVLCHQVYQRVFF